MNIEWNHNSVICLSILLWTNAIIIILWISRAQVYNLHIKDVLKRNINQWLSVSTLWTCESAKIIMSWNTDKKYCKNEELQVICQYHNIINSLWINFLQINAHVMIENKYKCKLIYCFVGQILYHKYLKKIIFYHDYTLKNWPNL